MKTTGRQHKQIAPAIGTGTINNDRKARHGKIGDNTTIGLQQHDSTAAGAAKQWTGKAYKNFFAAIVVQIETK